MEKPKRKNEQITVNYQLQWVLIALIVCAFLSMTNVAWFWWVPFLAIGFCYHNGDCDTKSETEILPIKPKNDDIV